MTTTTTENLVDLARVRHAKAVSTRTVSQPSYNPDVISFRRPESMSYERWSEFRVQVAEHLYQATRGIVEDAYRGGTSD